MSILSGPPLERATWVGPLTFPGFLTEVARRHGDREALVLDDPLRGGETVRLSFDDLRALAWEVATGLAAAGAGRGSRVAILMGNRPECIAAILGTGVIGAVAVPLSTFSTPAELEFLLAHSGAGILLTQASMRRRDFLGDLLALCPEAAVPGPDGIRSARFPALRWIVAVGIDDARGAVATWEGFLDAGRAGGAGSTDALAAGVDPADPGLIIYSSGTTDRPKGMLHAQRSPTLQFWHQARVFGRTERTRMWTALPVFWTAGLCTAVGAALAAGACSVLQEVFEPGAALALLARERVTEPYGLPHQIAAMEEHPDWSSTDLSALRCVFGKSAFARHPSVTDPDRHWQFPVGYGLSETCASFATHFSDVPRAVQRESMGPLLPGNELRVVDPATRRELGAGEEGELTVRGPTLMEHYVGVRREDCLDAEGFFHTGDVGWYDDAGFVHFAGRRTEMIKTGMANVSPAELEVAMRACRPVKLAWVVGVPDDALGQRVVMCVTLKEGMTATEEEIKAFLAERVAAYKVPRHVLFFEEGAIPMTASDTKVRDAELLPLVLARLGDGAPSDGGAR
jgi:acyl-CoA synthetase (AMP-forming)/AMP-acid ligase II